MGEYLSTVVNYKGFILWKRRKYPFGNRFVDGDIRHYNFIHDENLALEWMNSVINDGEYKDVHHYVFTPASFEFLIYELRLMGLIDLEIEKVRAPYGNEFMVTMKKCSGEPVRDDRKKLKILRRRLRQNRILF